MSISETSWKLFDVLPFLIYVHFPLFYFVKEKAVENIIWLEILWRAIMCNMCAFMHDGGYICDKRWQIYQETFWFLSKLHVFLQTKTQAIVNHQKNLACANLSYLNHIDIMHCKIAFFTICLDLRLLYFAHLSALLMSSVFSLFLHRTKFQVFLFFWNIISPPVLCIFPTKGALLWCDFTHGRTHGRMHNYLTILPNTPHHHKNIHIYF